MAPPLKHDGQVFVYTTSIMLLVTTLAMALRVLAKSKTKTRITADDLWMFAAYIVHIADNTLMICSKSTT